MNPASLVYEPPRPALRGVRSSEAGQSELGRLDVCVAPLPFNEAPRLAELQSYGILDTVPEQAFDDLTTLAASICRAPIALVSLVDSHRLWFKSRVGMDVRAIARDVGFCSHAIHRPAGVFEIADTLEDRRFATNPMVPEVRFYAGASLVSPKGMPVGTICVLDSQPRALVDSEREGLASLARQVVAQLELRKNVQQLASDASTDPLTGAWNRRAFDRRLRSEWHDHAKTGQPMSLLMLDVDHFKRLNDTDGHEAGDAVLVELTRRVRKVMRAGDMFARIGGEEFAVLLPGAQTQAALAAGEKIRAEIAKQPWEGRAVTASIGVATVAPSLTSDPYGALALADAAMYRAKHDGRNCVRSATA